MEAAFEGFAELGEGGGLREGVDGFGKGDALLGVEGLGAGVVLTGDDGLETAKGIDGLDGVVGAEGKGDVVAEERSPGVAVLGAVFAEALAGPQPCR